MALSGLHAPSPPNQETGRYIGPPLEVSEPFCPQVRHDNVRVTSTAAKQPSKVFSMAFVNAFTLCQVKPMSACLVPGDRGGLRSGIFHHSVPPSTCASPFCSSSCSLLVRDLADSPGPCCVARDPIDHANGSGFFFFVLSRGVGFSFVSRGLGFLLCFMV
jgi:hypothetical protein